MAVMGYEGVMGYEVVMAVMGYEVVILSAAKNPRICTLE